MLFRGLRNKPVFFFFVFFKYVLQVFRKVQSAIEVYTQVILEQYLRHSVKEKKQKITSFACLLGSGLKLIFL